MLVLMRHLRKCVSQSNKNYSQKQKAKTHAEIQSNAISFESVKFLCLMRVEALFVRRNDGIL